MYYLLFTVFGLCTATVERPDLAVDHISESLRQDAWAVIRNTETTLDIKSPRAYSTVKREAVTIFDKRSGYDVLQVNYNKYCDARIKEAAIYDADGALLRKVRKDEIRDYSYFDGYSIYNDIRYLELDLKYSRYPYTVEFVIETSCSETRSYPNWRVQGFHDAVQSASLKVVSDDHVRIHTKALIGDFSFTETTDKKKLVREWGISDLKALPYVENHPPRHEIFPTLLISPDVFEIEGYTGSMADWESFGKFIYDINYGKDAVSGSMEHMVQEMVADIDDPRAQIAALYDFLKGNMRYVSVQLGLGGWQAFSSSYVEANRYGDCKALTYFMKGLLKAVNIEAYPALIESGEDPLLIREFAVPYFNHVILFIPDEQMWLECTSNSFPAGYLSADCLEREVLLITPEGGVLSRTPDRKEVGRAVQTVDSVYFTSGRWYISSSQTFTGAGHERFRYIITYASESDREKYFREGFPLSVDHIDRLEYSSAEHTAVSARRFDVQLTHLGSKAGSRLFIPVVPHYQFDQTCGASERSMDVFLRDEVNIVNEISIGIPDGYRVEVLPEAVSIIEDDLGRYALSLHLEGSEVRIQRTLELQRARLGSADHQRLCDFYKSIRKANKSRMVLVEE